MQNRHFFSSYLLWSERWSVSRVPAVGQYALKRQHCLKGCSQKREQSMKYIKQVEDSLHLKTFVERELEELGIKLPKKKNRTRNNSLVSER